MTKKATIQLDKEMQTPLITNAHFFPIIQLKSFLHQL